MKKRIVPVTIFIFIAACHTPRDASQAPFQKWTLPAFNEEGHRGTRGLMPENTIPAMKKAIDLGVNTVEVDVVISKDKKVVISHDIYFHADFSLTPEGNRLSKKEGEDRLLYNMPYDSIKKYDVGMKPHPGFPDQQKMPAYKPLLAELIDSTDAYAKKKGTPIYYNIELKANQEWDGSKQPPVEELVDLTMAVIREKKLENRCYLQSFDFRAMQVIHKKYPRMTTAILIGGGEKRSLDRQLEDLGYIPEMYSPSFTLVTRELVDACHKKGIRIIPWTVNSTEQMKKLKQLGVDGIITDYPNYFQHL